MPTITSNGSGLWSAGATWVGGAVPIDNDTVVIAAGHVVEFDVDQSAFPNGIAGITVTGTLKLTRTAGTYYMKIKAATVINGAGVFDCGASAIDAIPFAAKHTITGGSGWYISGSSGTGLTMTVYAAEPAIKSIFLTGPEAIGSTVLDVGTDVTGDIWRDGDTIIICNINKARDMEVRVIAVGGIAPGTITITSGLTAAKIAGSTIHLMTRNVRFVSGGGSVYTIRDFKSGKLIIAGGEFVGLTYHFAGANLGAIVSGGSFYTPANNMYSFVDCLNMVISGGVFGGWGALYGANGSVLSGGTFSGMDRGFTGGVGISLSGGIFYGINYVFYSVSGCFISGVVAQGNNYVVFTSNGIIDNCTFTGNRYAFHQSFFNVTNCLSQSNTNDISSSVIKAFNTSFLSPENTGYGGLAREIYSESINHDAVPAAFRSWTKGGITSSQAVTVPVGYTQANQTVLENANFEGFWQKEILVAAGASVSIEMWLRKDAAMAYLPRCIIFDKAAADPFMGGAGIHTFTMTNSVDTWESETYVYSNLTANDITLVIRFQGMNAANNMFSTLTLDVINVDLTSALALLNTIDQTTRVNGVVLSAAAVDAILDDPVEGAYTMRQALRIMLASLAGKATGGGTATITFRDINDTADRITATVDINGNRSAVVVVV